MILQGIVKVAISDQNAHIFTLPGCAAKIKAMRQFTLEYWKDDDWYVGRLKEMPAVMSQGATLEELQSMIRDAYHLMVEDAAPKAPLFRRRSRNFRSRCEAPRVRAWTRRAWLLLKTSWCEPRTSI
jgi:predicted RNase H-like HicB family nuclease